MASKNLFHLKYMKLQKLKNAKIKLENKCLYKMRKTIDKKNKQT